MDQVTAHQRPVRKNFYSNVTIGNNGARIDDAVVKAAITEVEPKMIRRQMKAQGWVAVRVFDREGYNKAFADYRADQKTAATAARTAVITESFESVEQTKNARVERALATLLPLYQGVSDRKIVDSFKKIIRIVGSNATSREDMAAAH
jgi:hypothetical protein